jgi:type I restriction enzyme S subunit
VDFEFPISAEYAASIGKPELAGQPYKSSGGEMVFNEVLKQEIPKGWETVAYTEMFSLCGGGTPKTEVDEYWNGNIPFFTPKDTGSSYYSVDTEKSITELGLKNSSTKLYKKDTVFITARGTVGELALASKPMAMNQSCYAALMKSYNAQYFAHQHSLNALKSLTNEANGGVFGALVTRDFDGCMVINPKECICKYNKVAKNVYQMILNVQNETSLLNKLQNLLLAGIAKGEIF